MAKGKFEKWLQPEGLTLIEGWARDGLTDEQIAKNMGIAPDTLYEWKKRFPEITESLKKGKEVVDFEVENALLKSAMGYSYDEIKFDERGNEIGRTRKNVPPNPTALIFWLKNRRPDKWRDKQITAQDDKNDDGVEIINDAPS